jgi:hypothetical protein
MDISARPYFYSQWPAKARALTVGHRSLETTREARDHKQCGVSIDGKPQSVLQDLLGRFNLSAQVACHLLLDMPTTLSPAAHTGVATEVVNARD